MQANTENDTCSDGKALPAASKVLRKCSDEPGAASIAKFGIAVGIHQNTASAIAVIAAQPMAMVFSSRRSLASSTGSAM
ncbi:hypothetical protein D9M69_645800 [compost metagenome]